MHYIRMFFLIIKVCKKTWKISLGKYIVITVTCIYSRHLGTAYVFMQNTQGPCDGLYVDV